MNSITKDYLTGIIFKRIADNINIHRQSKRHLGGMEHASVPTDEEVLDFIISIPYFDDRLKDFLIGNLGETTIIISQSWENEFIIKTKLWADSMDWLHGNDRFLKAPMPDSINTERRFLSLPY